MTPEEEQKALKELREQDPAYIEAKKLRKGVLYSLFLFIGGYASLVAYCELKPEDPPPPIKKYYASPKWNPTREFYEMKSIDLETGEVTYFSREKAKDHSDYAKMVSARSSRFNKEALLEELMDELDFWELYEEYRCD